LVLAQTTTISDVRYKLVQPERYVRLVLSNIVAAEKEYGPVVVRIGVTGTGQFPHYRIDRREKREILDSELTAYIALQAFNGRNHQPLAMVPEGEEGDILRDEHWSTGDMTREEVMMLLGEIRQKRR
jgi:hypothetical protein